MTWREVATRYPEFVQWIVQRHGGVPEGSVTQADYERFSAEYANALTNEKEEGHAND